MSSTKAQPIEKPKIAARTQPVRSGAIPAPTAAQRRESPTRKPQPSRPARGGDHDLKDALRSVQRVAGNHGMTALVMERRSTAPKRHASPESVPVAVQRLKTTSVALAAHMGSSKAKGFAGMGASSYAGIVKLVAAYELQKRQLQLVPSRPGSGTEAKLAATLEKLDRLATKWVNTHGQTDQPNRRIAIMSLLDELAAERVQITKGQAQSRYLQDAAAGPTRGGYGVTSETPMHGKIDKLLALDVFTDYQMTEAVTKLTTEGMDPAVIEADRRRREEELRRRKAFMAKWGISEAEYFSIFAYTDANSAAYRFINAGTANDDKWMMAPKTGHARLAQDLSKGSAIGEQHGINKLKEEASLHTALVLSAMKKLPPHVGNSYRGESVTQKDFDALKVGDPITLRNLTSTSHIRETSQSFALSNLDDDRPVGLLWTYTSCGGKNVEKLSAAEGEGEVLLPPGTMFKIAAITPFPSGNPKYRVYEVKTEFIAPATPSQPAGGLPSLGRPGPGGPPGGLPPLPGLPGPGGPGPAAPPLPPGGLPPLNK